jgi:hypothetical protein
MGARIMDIPLARKIAGKKFMWDGIVYTSRDEARQTMESYKQDGFEVHFIPEQDRCLIYTRRLASEARQ